MNPDQIISIHLAWKLALRQAVREGTGGNLDPDMVGSSDRCELGRWLESPLACFEGMEELRNLHRGFHAAAGRIVEGLREGQPAELLAPFEAQLEDLSVRMVSQLGARAAHL